MNFESEKQEPVAAQHRFRHPQKTMPDWSVWQPAAIANRPAWEIDSQGYEVEYRLLYTAPVHAIDISQECVDETVKCEHDWGSVTDDALIEEVRRRGFTIRDAQIEVNTKDWKEIQCPCGHKMYVKHTGREWVGLEEEEILKCFDSVALGQVEGACVIDKHVNIFNAIRAIEAKLKEKNGG